MPQSASSLLWVNHISHSNKHTQHAFCVCCYKPKLKIYPQAVWSSQPHFSFSMNLACLVVVMWCCSVDISDVNVFLVLLGKMRGGSSMFRVHWQAEGVEDEINDIHVTRPEMGCWCKLHLWDTTHVQYADRTRCSFLFLFGNWESTRLCGATSFIKLMTFPLDTMHWGYMCVSVCACLDYHVSRLRLERWRHHCTPVRKHKNDKLYPNDVTAMKERAILCGRAWTLTHWQINYKLFNC